MVAWRIYLDYEGLEFECLESDSQGNAKFLHKLNPLFGEGSPSDSLFGSQKQPRPIALRADKSMGARGRCLEQKHRGEAAETRRRRAEIIQLPRDLIFMQDDPYAASDDAGRVTLSAVTSSALRPHAPSSFPAEA